MMSGLEQLIGYLEKYRRWQLNPERMAVAISRQTGSGSIPIAEKLGEYLQAHGPGAEAPWAVLDSNLMAKVLEDHNLPARLAQFLPEDRIPVVRDWIEEALGLHPEYRVVIQQSVETILNLALLGNVILVGRGANIITSRLPNILRVRLVGSLENRVARIQQMHHLTREKAESFIRSSDRGRVQYVKKYFGKSVSDVLLYDLTINTDLFSDEESARLIGEAVLSRSRSISLLNGAVSRSSGPVCQ